MNRLTILLLSLALVALVAAPRQAAAQTQLETTLLGLHEVPPFMSGGQGTVTATLDGSSLTLSGSFDDLEGALFEIAGTPAHIHVGGPSMNGPVVVPLVVTPDADNLGGTLEAASNTFDLATLTYPDGIDADSVMSALMNGNAYVNIHTEANMPGELRGQVLMADNNAPTAAAITAPADGAALTIEGAAATPFAPMWSESTDPEGDEIAYVWQLAADDQFQTIVFSTNVSGTTFETDFGTVDMLLEGAGVAVGSSVTLYHRAIATDGSEEPATTTAASVVLTRGVVYGYETTLADINEVQPVMVDGAMGDAQVSVNGTMVSVTGSFSGLGSKLMNIAGTPAHIHLGGPAENGPVAIPLVVDAPADSLSGTFEMADNTFDLATLTLPDGVDADSVASALMMGHAYFNIHTMDHPSGALRGQVLPAPNSAPEAVAITAPADGASLTIEGDPATPFVPQWEMSTDPDGNEVVYIWQLAASDDFAAPLVNVNVGSQTMFETDFGTVDMLLEGAGVAVGSSVTLYHRAIASDGSEQPATTTAASVVLTRGVVDRTAMAQVIHAAPDPALATVDVYLDGALVLDDFMYQEASPFVEVPAEAAFTIELTAPDDMNNVLYTLNVDEGGALTEDEDYIITAAGVAGSGDDYEFGLFITDADQMASSGDQVALHAFHGGVNAPAVDVVVLPDNAVLFEDDESGGDFAFGDYTGYVEVPPAVYTVGVTPEDDNDNVLAAFVFDLSGAGGLPVTVVATGYFTGAPAEDRGFTLIGVLPDGTVVMPTMPAISIAEARMMDGQTVTVEGVLNTPDYGFNNNQFFVQDSTGGINVFAAGRDLAFEAGDRVRLTGEISAFNDQVQIAVDAGELLEEDAGVPAPLTVGPGAFAVDSDQQGVRVLVLQALELIDPTGTDFDPWPADGISGGSGVTVGAVNPAGTDTFALRIDRTESFFDGQPAPDSTFFVVGTLGRFRDQAQIFPFYEGDIIEATAAQVIHAAPDPALATVDVYLNELLLIDDFEYQTATPFVSLPAAVPFTLTLTASDDADQVLYTLDVPAEGAPQSGEDYIITAAGVAGSGDDYEFGLFITDADQMASADDQVALHAFHGGVNAPAVDVVVLPDNAVLFEDDESGGDFAFGDYTGYVEVPPAVYEVGVTGEDTNDDVLAGFRFDLSGAGGAAVTVVATGYFTDVPAEDRAFTLIGVLPDGTVVMPDVITSDEPTTTLPERFALQGNFPNPFNPSTTIAYDLPRPAEVTLALYDVLGREVRRVELGEQAPGFGRTYGLEAGDLASGVYVYRLSARMGDELQAATGRMVLVK